MTHATPLAYEVRADAIVIDLGHTELDDLYCHVRDDHGLPIVGQYSADALRELHERMHDGDSRDSS